MTSSTPSTRTNPRTREAAPRAITLCLLLATALAPLAASALTKTHVSECHLSDGSKFVLRAKQKRSLLNFHPHGSDGQTAGWEIFYKPKGKFRETQAPGVLPFHGPDRPDCSKLGLVHGTPVVYHSFLDKNGKWFPFDRIPSNVIGAADYGEPGVRELLEKNDVGSLYLVAFVAPVGREIVYEAPLLAMRSEDPNGTVTAVMQSISRDGGTTWSPPVISRKALIYELGKSTLSQSFVGKQAPAKPGS